MRTLDFNQPSDPINLLALVKLTGATTLMPSVSDQSPNWKTMFTSFVFSKLSQAFRSFSAFLLGTGAFTSQHNALLNSSRFLWPTATYLFVPFAVQNQRQSTLKPNVSQTSSTPQTNHARTPAWRDLFVGTCSISASSAAVVYENRILCCRYCHIFDSPAWR